MTEVSDEMVQIAGNVLMQHGVNAPEQVIFQATRAALTAAIAARPSPTGEKVEVVAWRWKGHDGKWVYEEGDPVKRAMREYDGIIVEDLYSAATIAALVAERDEAQLRIAYLEEEIVRVRDLAVEHSTRAATANARVERLEEAFRIATDALDGLSYIHDGNPSDAMADMLPVDYARHMLYEARMVAREAAANARAALTGGEDG